MFNIASIKVFPPDTIRSQSRVTPFLRNYYPKCALMLCSHLAEINNSAMEAVSFKVVLVLAENRFEYCLMLKTSAVRLMPT
jgi:hypothetical protein